MSQSVVDQNTLSKSQEAAGPFAVRSAGARKEEKRQERDEDLLFGQPVIVTARWIFVVSGLILAIWNAETIDLLRLQLIVIFLLAIENFYVHAQLLTGKPVRSHVIYVSSAADLLLISILILFQGGFDSSLYVFYFPAIAALSVAFSSQHTAEYTAGAMAVYATFSAFSIMDVDEILIIISRLLMIAAVAFCANRYWQIERSRRVAADVAQDELISKIEQQSTKAI
jgi:esterase/lipase superfamily enzyme